MARPAIILLVPVRNEAWILRTFLASASLWADHIVIADQSSDDGSRELAAAFPKVVVIDNPSADYSEVARQRLLIQEARRFPAPRVLVALDADEILSANVLDSAEWTTALQQPPGTLLAFPKVELYGSTERYYLHSVEDKNSWIPFGFIDDGTEHEGSILHTCRIPERADSPRFQLNDVVVLHFNRINQSRSDSRDRWYRCFERISFPDKNIQTIHGLYDFFERLRDRFHIRPSKPDWFANYRKSNIDFSFGDMGTVFWWDWDILRMFDKYGTAPFRHLDIWSFDWEALRLEGQSQKVPGLPSRPIDVPRRVRDRLIRAALRWPHARGLMNRVTWRLFHYGLIETRSSNK
jgi:hypothetical protein